jgi:hypothetical protein
MSEVCYLCGDDIQEVPDNHHPDKDNKPDLTESVHHKCHMIHHGIYPKNYNELRQLVEFRMIQQEMRIKYQMRLKNFQKLGFEPTKEDKEILRSMKRREDQLTVEYSKIIRKLPIWKKWLSGVMGTGEASIGQLIAYIGDIKKFSSVPKLWSYFGYGIYDGKIQAHMKGHSKNYGYEKRELMFVISKTFVSHRKKGCVYADIYDEYKKRYQTKHPEFSKKHIHLMSLRKVSKIFLRDLWNNWNRIEPYVVEADYDRNVEMTNKELSLQPLILTEGGLHIR